MLGTVAYMSPEQVRGRDLDTRSDLFSFGAVLYEMATGDVPFHGESSAVICEAIMNRAPVPAVRLNHDVPAKLEDIINKALEKDGSLRYQHASEMRSDLQRVKRDTDSGRMALTTSQAGSSPSAASGLSSSGSRAAVAANSGAALVAANRSSGKIALAVAGVVVVGIALLFWQPRRPAAPALGSVNPKTLPCSRCKTWAQTKIWIFSALHWLSRLPPRSAMSVD